MKADNTQSPQHLQSLRRIFQGLSDEVLVHILQHSGKYQLEPGEYLFRQGTHGNTLYIVLQGRLRAVRHDETGTHILGDIGESEPAGEFAMFTNEARMASVLAIRKTIVLEITKDEYLNIVAQNPSFASTLTSVLIKRMARNRLEHNSSSAPKNIALINLQSDADLSPWTVDIENTLKASGISTQVFSEGSLPEENYRSIFDSLEKHDGLNVLICSDAYPEWSKQCVIYADLVIVATKFTADPHLYDIERSLELYANSITNKKVYIVFLHDAHAPLPRHTGQWISKRKVDLHLHLRQGHARDTRRFCRIISNQAVGLVLGGGGTKGYAHVGAVKALLEAGVEIDFIGGTSAGALYGIMMTYCDLDFDKIHDICRQAAQKKLTSNDLTIPVLSFMSGKKVSRFVHQFFGDHELEDIWLNSYCVSSNFSNSQLSVHERGLIRQKVMASIAIPGIFPPIVIDQDLHVDGGVVDNLPIEPMYRFPLRHIIAISLSSNENVNVDCTELPSSRRLIWNKLTRRKTGIPGLGSLIVDSMTLNSRHRQETFKSKVSLYIELDLKDVGFLDDKKWKQTMQKGQDQVEEFLENLPKTEKFWLKAALAEAAESLRAH